MEADLWPTCLGQPQLPSGPSSDRDLVANFSDPLMDTHFGRAQSRVVFVAGQPKLDYKFAPKANRRPSQSRASLKTQEKHKFTKREKIDYGEKFGDSAQR